MIITFCLLSFGSKNKCCSPCRYCLVTLSCNSIFAWSDILIAKAKATFGSDLYALASSTQKIRF